MLIGIISDSHGHTHRTLSALRLLGEFNIEALLHCGDIGSPVIPSLIECPAHFVLGNVDETEADELLAACRDAGHELHGLMADLTIGARRIAATHGHHGKLLRAAVAGGEFDLVCYGHTHQAEKRRAGKTLVLNPGALYRANPPTCAVVDLASMTAEILTVA
jgi:putative phosphoesterase